MSKRMLVHGSAMVLLSLACGGSFDGLDDRPLEFMHPSSPVDPDLIMRSLVEDLVDDRTARLTGPQMTALLNHVARDDTRAGLSVFGGVMTVDISLPVREEPTDWPRWMNIHAKGRFEMESGVFTSVDLSELHVAGWNLGFLTGEADEQAEALNFQLFEVRQRNPQQDQWLRGVESAFLQGDGIQITITEEARRRLSSGGLKRSSSRAVPSSCTATCDPMGGGNVFMDAAYEQVYQPCLEQAMRAGTTATALKCTERATTRCLELCERAR